MSVTVLGPSDYRVMPWKNGLGKTTELAIRPRGASLTGAGKPFTWRVSLADLAASGPFSVFPGIDRVILQTAGAPMTLTQGQNAVTLAPRSPLAFSGDAEAHGVLGGTPAKDFNVMTRRGHTRADVSTLSLHGAGACVGVSWRQGDVLVHVLEGNAAAHMHGGRSLPLSEGATLVADVDAKGGCNLVLASGLVVTLVIASFALVVP